jgi:outer membrane biosynthesis protein TonB
MRVAKNKQMLTTGIVDANRNQISPDVIDWTEFDKNPVLLYNVETEGHGGVVVGKVTDRERVGDGFAGRLVFLDNVEAADTAWEKYSQGFLPFVSVGGWGAGHYDEENDVFVVEQYLIKEVSLVKLPANIEARTIETKSVAAADQWFVEGREETGQEVRYLEMSAEGVLEASVENEPTVEQPIEPTVEQPIEASATEEPVQTEETTVEQPIEASVENEPTQIEASERQPMPEGMTWHEHSQINKTNHSMINKTFQELNCDADFKKRLQVLNSAFRTNAPSADNTAENVETVKILASAMLQDEKMVIIASATNFTNGVTRERKNGLQFLVECAAGNAAAATLAAADLGIIKWLSLFYEKLLPNNTFMRSLRFVPMSDREGAIYVESGINPATYIGATTPVNAPNYTYDDIKRTIARQVFSIQPVTFQNADMAILAYDKQSIGWRTAMDSLMSDVCTYILQVAANTPNITKVRTSGEVFSSQGKFAKVAPNSNVNIKGITAQDLIDVEGSFLEQNYFLNDRMVETVLPPFLFSKLAGSAEFITNLTRDLDGTVRNELRFMGNRITPRSLVAAADTANGNVVLDESLYADKKVQADGSLQDIDPAVTGATHVGAGLAFVENEIIAGIGTIDVIVMPDPKNYGVTMSGWMSAGATVARQDGKGVALIVPSVE